MSIVAPHLIIGDKSVAFDATSTEFDYGPLSAKFNVDIPFTILALCRPVGSGENAFSYIFAKTPSASTLGARLYIDHNAGSPRVTFALDSNSGGNPTRIGGTGHITYGKWYWIAAASIASLTATDLRVYVAEVNNPLREQTYGTATNGTTVLDDNSTLNWVIGNREGGDRTFNGDIACVFRWNRAFTVENLNRAILLGPESVRPNQLIFSWVNGYERISGWTPTITARGVGQGVRYPIKTLGRTPYPAFPVGAGQTIAVGQVTETDVAQAITVNPKRRLLGQVTETDLSQSIARVKSRTLGQITETDLAQSVSKIKTRALGQVTETDLAQPITSSGTKIIAVGQVTETDLAQAIAKRKLKALSQITETDLAQTVTRVKSRTVGQIAETDLAQAIAKRKARTVGQVVETDLAQTITTSGNKIIAVGQIAETDVAQAIGRIKRKALAQITETDLAQAIAVNPKRRLVGQVSETDLAQTITKIGGVYVPPASIKIARAENRIMVVTL